MQRVIPLTPGLARWRPFVAALAIALVAFFAAVPADAQTPKDTLAVGLYIPLASVDPHVVVTRPDFDVLKNVFEALVDLVRDTTQIGPVLATRWSTSEDGKAWTFTLRPGVVFHDGTPFNAEAVKFNFDRSMALKKGYSWTVPGLDRVEAVDATTVRFVLKRPQSSFLKVLSLFPMVSPASIKANDKGGDWAMAWSVDHGIGTGPYRFDSVKVRGDIVLAKHDRYWGGWQKPHASRAIMRAVPEVATQRLLLERGDLDVAQSINPSQLPELEKNPNLKVVKGATATQMYLRFHARAGATKDRRVRQALAYAWDADAFAKFMGGLIRPSDGPAPREIMAPGYRPPEIPYRLNMDRAKQLLAEAGYPNGGFTIDYYYNTGDEEKRLIGVVLQSQAAKLGVQVNINVTPWPTLVSKSVAWKDKRQDPPEIGAYGQYISPRYPDGAAFFQFMYHSSAQSGNGRNFMFYANPEVDRLVDEALAAPNEKAATAFYERAAKLIVDDAPDVFIGKLVDVAVMRKEVQGYYVMPANFRGIRLYELSKP
jgi:peptide/nickel transport system substrate-binding protein